MYVEKDMFLFGCNFYLGGGDVGVVVDFWPLTLPKSGETWGFSLVSPHFLHVLEIQSP